MILSKAHKFIFIKNRKVGSTSSELALQPICGPEDILTPDHIHNAKEDVLRDAARNHRGPFNPLRELAGCRSALDAARVMRDFVQRPKFYNHMRASSVRARVPGHIWSTYYSFTFERNPWDKVVSFYYWYGRSHDLPPFNDFIQNHRSFGTLDQVLPSDWTRYTHNNKVIVDDVFDYGDLDGGMQTALERAGVATEIRQKVSLGREKSNVRKKDPIVLAPETDAIIRRVFAREIATFDFCATPKPGLFQD